jgi:hypothetical protein
VPLVSRNLCCCVYHCWLISVHMLWPEPHARFRQCDYCNDRELVAWYEFYFRVMSSAIDCYLSSSTCQEYHFVIVGVISHVVGSLCSAPGLDTIQTCQNGVIVGTTTSCRCALNCASCTISGSLSTCNACNAPHLVSSGGCVAVCPTGTHANNSTVPTCVPDASQAPVLDSPPTVSSEMSSVIMPVAVAVIGKHVVVALYLSLVSLPRCCTLVHFGWVL